MLNVVPRSKTRHVVADRLKAYIRDENLKPGDRLPTETDLAARFGVNRLTLREATKALEFLGIVEARPGRGLTIGRMSMDRVSEYLGFHPALQDSSPVELIEARVVIELGALRHLSARMKQDDSIYTRLDHINLQLRKARTLSQWVDLDIQFHRGLIEASGLTPLLAFGDILAVFFQRFRESVKRAEWPLGIESHQAIIDALRAGAVRKAEAELKTHIESHRGRWEATR